MSKKSKFKSILKKILIFIGSLVSLLLMLILILIVSFFIKEKTYNPYQQRDNGIYYIPQNPKFMAEAKLEGADEGTFEALKCNYAKDKNRAYYFADPLEGADAESFQVVKCDLAKDKNQVYKQGDVVQQADPETFELINNYYGKDKRAIYADLQMVQGIDLETFETIGHQYGKDAERVYYQGKIVPEAEPETFEPIESGYWRDEKKLYYNGEYLEGRDASTFEQLKFEEHYTSRDFTKDSTGLYLNNQKLEGATPETFQLMEQPDFGKDDQHFFYKHYQIEGVDIGSLKLIGGKYSNDEAGYFKDRNGVYFVYEELASGNTITPQILKNADPETLEVDVRHFIGNLLAKTKDFVYFRGKKIEGVDVKSFWVFHPHYAKDSERVYGIFQDPTAEKNVVPLEGSEPWNFEVLSEKDDEMSFAKDGKQVYSNGKVIPIEEVDVPSVELLPYGFFKDANSVYCQLGEAAEWKILEGADPQSFEFVYNGAEYSRDKDNFYHYCESIDSFPEEVNSFVSNPENALKMACGNFGGEWKLFDTDCAETCNAAEGLNFHCQDLENYSCSCGPGKCWNGSECEEFEYHTGGI